MRYHLTWTQPIIGVPESDLSIGTSTTLVFGQTFGAKNFEDKSIEFESVTIMDLGKIMTEDVVDKTASMKLTIGKNLNVQGGGKFESMLKPLLLIAASIPRVTRLY